MSNGPLEMKFSLPRTKPDSKYLGDLHLLRKGPEPFEQYYFHAMHYDTSSREWSSLNQEEALQIWSEHLNQLMIDHQQVLDLEEKLQFDVIALIEQFGTPGQIKIAYMLYQGYTQYEIMKEINVKSNSGITKAMQGSPDYTTHKKYGGLRNKLIKHINKSDQIKSTMKKMYSIDPTGCYVPFYTTIVRNCFDNYSEYMKWLENER